jgi:hypothetical protein
MELAAVVEEFLVWNGALTLGLLKCSGALTIEGVPAVIIGLSGHKGYEAVVGGKDGGWRPAYLVRFFSGGVQMQEQAYLPSHT